MTFDEIFPYLKTIGSTLFSLSFVGIALWNGSREIVLRRKVSRVRQWLEVARRFDPRWNGDELMATARGLCKGFFEAFNAGEDERLRRLIHPEAWEELSLDLMKIRGDSQERRLLNFELTKVTLWHVENGLEQNERGMVVQVDLTGHYETWKRTGLVRSRFSSVKEFWEFRTYLQEWRVFDRHDSDAWVRFAKKKLGPIGPGISV